MEDTNREEAREEVEEEACIIVINNSEDVFLFICLFFCVHVLVFSVSFKKKTKGKREHAQ